MASLPYNQIVQRLEKLEPAEVWMLLSELQGRIRRQPKHSLKEYEPTGELNRDREDWVEGLRREWDES